MKKLFFLILIYMAIFLSSPGAFAADYYVSNAGNDLCAGTTSDSPWKTVSRVNNYPFQPGDVVHFKAGGVWREYLKPVSGSVNGFIEYTSYGIGSKPCFLGSISRSQKNNWCEISENIWSLASTGDNSILSTPTIPVKQIVLSEENNTTNSIEIKNDILRLKCADPGKTSQSLYLSLANLKIKNGINYKLAFKAKANKPFKIPYINLLMNKSPWSNAFSSHTDWSPNISTKWTEYTISYTANMGCSDARIAFFLGGAIPPGTVLEISGVHFAESDNSRIYEDIGNIIFDQGKTCGIKVSSEKQLRHQNQFWYNPQKHILKMFSLENPAAHYPSIELALAKDIIEQGGCSYITYRGLELKYGGACGINGENTSHINIIDCDISYIGGGYITIDEVTERYGNGINFWNNAHDNYVSGCQIWQVYDAALSNQGNGDGNKQYNIAYRNNHIWECQWSFEYWNQNENGITHDIYFEKNYCQNTAGCWGNGQRKDNIGGRQITLYMNTAATTRFFIRDNIFENSRQMLYISSTWNGIDDLVIERNKYIQLNFSNEAFYYNEILYASNEFKKYRSASGKDTESILTIKNDAHISK